MSDPDTSPQAEPSTDEQAVRALYQRLLDGWNACDAGAMAAPFAEDC